MRFDRLGKINIFGYLIDIFTEIVRDLSSPRFIKGLRPPTHFIN